MPDVSFVGLLIVAVVAFLAPLLLGLSPARRLPSVVVEIVGGIVIGPSALGWVMADLPISILSVLGLAFLLFLAGLEVELGRLRGRLLLYVSLAFLVSLGLALVVGYGLYATGQIISPLLVAIILVATALGVVVPLLLVRGLPALLYRPLVGERRSVIAGLLQATSLLFIVAATQIGLVLGLITRATSAALIAAGLLSVLIFPVLALSLARRGDSPTTVMN